MSLLKLSRYSLLLLLHALYYALYYTQKMHVYEEVDKTFHFWETAFFTQWHVTKMKCCLICIIRIKINSLQTILKKKIYGVLYPTWRKFREVNRNHYFSVCVSMQIRVRPLTFILKFAYHLWHIIHHNERMCHVHSCSQYDVDLWPQGQI